jgi:hypothetical protein
MLHDKFNHFLLFPYMKTAAFIIQGRRMTYKIIAKFKQKDEEVGCFTVNSPRKGGKMYLL